MEKKIKKSKKAHQCKKKHQNEHCEHAHANDKNIIFEASHCNCCDDKSHEHNDKIKIIIMCIGAIIFLCSFLFEGVLKNVLCIAAYIFLGFDILLHAIKNILKGELFDENFLMSIATIGAILIGKYSEAVEVMLFYNIGEMLSDYAVEKSEKSVNSIMDIRPDTAYINEKGERKKVLAKDIVIGQVIEILPGERIPLDGIVIEGESFLDLSCITGESKPERTEHGKKVMSGAVNLSGRIVVQVTEEYLNSTASKIIAAMKNSLDKKAKSEKFITAFAKKYTPTVIAAAFVIAFIVPLFNGFLFSKWIYRALIFLVVSCPCALVISVPLSFFAGLGAASEKGIIIKVGNTIETLAKTNTAIFDKTGTLTTGVFEVTQINSVIDEKEFITLCAYAEHFSNHPIATAVKNLYKGEIDESLIEDFQELRGKGIISFIGGKKVIAGNNRLLEENGISITTHDSIGSEVHFSIDGEYAGFVIVSDVLRDVTGLERIRKMGYKTIMLTGDLKTIAEKTAKKIGINKVYSELLPQDKVRITETISKENCCIFVGDGINDAPVLAAADVGVAMGGIGSDAAIEASDMVLMKDDISGLVDAILISKKTMKIIRQNIIFSIGIKILVMLLSVFGAGAMWMAVIADVGTALIAILNAMRIFKFKKYN